MGKSVDRQYLVEFNRNKFDSINKVVDKVRQEGFDITLVPNHLTAVVIKKSADQNFSELSKLLISLLNPAKGSLIIGSSSGKQWFCSMKGNRAGELIEID